jgi:hypothetical protein
MLKDGYSLPLSERLLPNLSMLKLKRLEDYSEGLQIKLFSYSDYLNYMRDFLNPSGFFGDPSFICLFVGIRI